MLLVAIGVIVVLITIGKALFILPPLITEDEWAERMKSAEKVIPNAKLVPPKNSPPRVAETAEFTELMRPQDQIMHGGESPSLIWRLNGAQADAPVEERQRALVAINNWHGYSGFSEPLGPSIPLKYWIASTSIRNEVLAFVWVIYPDADEQLYYRFRIDLDEPMVTAFYRHGLTSAEKWRDVDVDASVPKQPVRQRPASVASSGGAYQFGILCADVICGSWPKRLGEFRGQLGVSDNPEAKTRVFEMEAAQLLAFTATMSFLDNARHEFSKTDIERFREGLDQTMIRRFVENGWSREELRLWAGQQDERSKEYRDIVYSMESPSFMLVGKAFVENALPELAKTSVDKSHADKLRPLVMATTMSSVFASSLGKTFGEMIDEQVKEGSLRANNGR